MTQAAMAASTVGRIHTAGAACIAGSGGVLAPSTLQWSARSEPRTSYTPMVLRPASAVGGFQLADRTAELRHMRHCQILNGGYGPR